MLYYDDDDDDDGAFCDDGSRCFLAMVMVILACDVKALGYGDAICNDYATCGGILA